ncbi:MAG: hypothetical protein J6Y02_01165 [Pseudobutyrivibrio sp.]|nr:hypothetical protein [Pseudobutyrivibrio sp.]
MKTKVSDVITHKMEDSGYSSEFELNHLEVSRMADGDYILHVNADVKIKKEDITRLIQTSLWHRK